MIDLQANAHQRFAAMAIATTVFRALCDTRTQIFPDFERAYFLSPSLGQRRLVAFILEQCQRFGFF